MNYCGQCHKIGQGCCLLDNYKKKYMFALTDSEINKIASITGLKKNEFVVEDIVDSTFFENINIYSNVFGQTMPNRVRLRLKVNDNKCCFLDHDGCTLRYSVRPYYCRLYPFWFKVQFTNQDSWFGKQVITDKEDLQLVYSDCYLEKELLLMYSESCLAQEKAVFINEVVRRLKGDREELWSIYKELMVSAYHHYQARKH